MVKSKVKDFRLKVENEWFWFGFCHVVVWTRDHVQGGWDYPLQCTGLVLTAGCILLAVHRQCLPDFYISDSKEVSSRPYGTRRGGDGGATSGGQDVTNEGK